MVCVGWKENSYFQTQKDQFAFLKAVRTIKQFSSITLIRIVRNLNTSFSKGKKGAYQKEWPTSFNKWCKIIDTNLISV